MTRLIAFCTFLTALFGASSAVAGTLEDIRSRGVLRWGGDMQGGEPYVSQDPSGKLVGFEVDLADAIARELGVRAEFVQADWSVLVATLERGTFDIAMNGLEVTPARRGRILFSKPYYSFALRLVARNGDTRITSDLSRLKGFRVGTLTGSLSEQTLRGYAEVVLYEGVQEPYLDLEHRRIDAVLLDDIIAERYGARPTLRVVGDVALGEYAIGIRLEDESLRKKIDEALEKIAQRGDLERILRKSNIWNDRQTALFATTPAPSTSNVSGRSPGTGRSTDTSTGPEGTLVTSTETSTPTSTKTSTETSGPLFEASAGLHMALGLAPSPALGARVGVALLPPPFRFALEGRFDANASESLPEGGSVASGFAGGSALACFQPGRPQVCAAFAMGDYRAKGVGLERTHSASALMMLVGARAAFDLPLGGSVVARPLGEIDVPLERHRIVVTDAATGATRSRYRVSPLAGLLGLDLAIRF